jgi:ubiquinol-cytochrome c reductase cytochrome c subunit
VSAGPDRRIFAGRVALVVGAFILSALGFSLADGPVIADPRARHGQAAGQPDGVATGRALFEQRCAGCHGPRGEGGGLGPPIVGLGPAVYDFQLSTGRMPLAQPRAQSVRKPPAFSPAQIDAIVAYLTSLGGGGIPIPDVDPGGGDLSQGQVTYQQNCSPCHGVSGNGGAVGDQVAPSVHPATATQVAEAVRIGPGTMPVFGAETLPEDDLSSLVRYVLYLESPEDVGGADLGHGGPIIEGFVALLFGLGSMALVVRFLGERS